MASEEKEKGQEEAVAGETERLKLEKDRIAAADSWLKEKEEDDRLKKEKDLLKKEDDRLTEEKDRLKKEDDRLKKEKDRLKKEKDRLKKEEDRLKKEKDRLKKADDRLKKEKDRLTEEKDRLKKEEDRLKEEKLKVEAEDQRIKQREATFLRMVRNAVCLIIVVAAAVVYHYGGGTWTASSGGCVPPCEIGKCYNGHCQCEVVIPVAFDPNSQHKKDTLLAFLKERNKEYPLLKFEAIDSCPSPPSMARRPLLLYTFNSAATGRLERSMTSLKTECGADNILSLVFVTLGSHDTNSIGSGLPGCPDYSLEITSELPDFRLSVNQAELDKSLRCINNFFLQNQCFGKSH